MDVRFLQDPITRSAVVAGAFELSILRSLLDEHHLCVINCVCLEDKAI